jgi:hypothetical protein
MIWSSQPLCPREQLGKSMVEELELLPIVSIPTPSFYSLYCWKSMYPHMTYTLAIGCLGEIVCTQHLQIANLYVTTVSMLCYTPIDLHISQFELFGSLVQSYNTNFMFTCFLLLNPCFYSGKPYSAHSIASGTQSNMYLTSTAIAGFALAIYNQYAVKKFASRLCLIV